MSGQSNLKRTVRSSFLSSLVCGVGGFVGSLIGGPVGIAVGAVIGATISSRIFRKSHWIVANMLEFYSFVALFTEFDSAPDVLRNDLTENDRMDLLERGRRTLSGWKEVIVDMILNALKNLPDCKTLDEFKCKFLYPLIEDVIRIGSTELIRYLFRLLFSSAWIHIEFKSHSSIFILKVLVRRRTQNCWLFSTLHDIQNWVFSVFFWHEKLIFNIVFLSISMWLFNI